MSNQSFYRRHRTSLWSSVCLLILFSAFAIQAAPTLREYAEFLPSINTSESSTPPTVRTIVGHVRAGMRGVSGIQLELEHCTVNSCDSVATTVTLHLGAYSFDAVADLQNEEFYRVSFENGPNGGNDDNPQYLAYWKSFPLPFPLQEGVIQGGSFDIDNIALESPDSGAYIVPWQPFTWQSRQVATDRYVWAYRDALNNECRSDILSTTSYTLMNQLPDCQRSYVSPRPWYIYVLADDWSKGFGRSYEMRNVVFITA